MSTQLHWVILVLVRNVDQETTMEKWGEMDGGEEKGLLQVSIPLSRGWNHCYTNYVRHFDPEIPLQATYLARSLSTSGLIPTGFEAIVTHYRLFTFSKFHCRIIRKYDFKNSCTTQE